MVGYFLENGRNVIWDFPRRPPGSDFRNFSFQLPHDGIYIFGQNIFSTRPFTITNIFRRNLTANADEFILGALSVLLIALLSEIVQAILMHTSRARRRPARKGVNMAFLVDEFYHFRNVWTHLFGRFARTAKSSPDPDKRHRVVTSVTILVIALGLMAADVLAVFLTQPLNVNSNSYQYNIRGSTPTFTDQNLGRFVRRLSQERPCVTPSFAQEGQERQYTISACTTIETQRNHDDTNFTGIITVGSWFHKAGSDHNVTFGNSRFTIKSRTVMYVSEGPAYRVLYDVIERDDFRFTKFLHELFITNVMEVSCNRPKESGGLSFENTWCDQILTLKSIADQRVDERNVIFWRRRNRTNEEAVVRGLVTSYQVTLERLWTSVNSGISPLTSTSLVEEVQGPGQYVNITNEAFKDNLDGLLQEEGRVAGLVALSIVFLIFALLLTALRVTLKPVSLGAMAWDARQKMSDTSSDSGTKGDVLPQTGSAGASTSASLNFDSNLPSRSTFEVENRAVDSVADIHGLDASPDTERADAASFPLENDQPQGQQCV